MWRVRPRPRTLPVRRQKPQARAPAPHGSSKSSLGMSPVSALRSFAPPGRCDTCPYVAGEALDFTPAIGYLPLRMHLDASPVVTLTSVFKQFGRFAALRGVT